MRVLLIWPLFESQSRKEGPPLGLLKIGGYHQVRGDDVRLIRKVLPMMAGERPDRVYVSSLCTYDRDPVVRQIHAVWSVWPGMDIRLGGIWASLLPDEARYMTGVEPHVGLLDWAEDAVPAWDLWPGDYSVAVASRGCVRACPWCSVALVDGEGFRPKPVDLVLSQLDLERPWVELWDNSVLSHPEFADLAGRLIGLGKRVRIRQGLDCRLLTAEQARIVRALRGGDIYLAYDSAQQGEAVQRAIRYLNEAGQSGGHIIVFVLYNWYDAATGQGDTLEEVLDRIDDIVGWGARAYPCRYRPIDSSVRLFISPKWGWDNLRRFNRARGDASRGLGVVYGSLREYMDGREGDCASKESGQASAKMGLGLLWAGNLGGVEVDH